MWEMIVHFLFGDTQQPRQVPGSELTFFQNCHDSLANGQGSSPCVSLSS